MLPLFLSPTGAALLGRRVRRDLPGGFLFLTSGSVDPRAIRGIVCLQDSHGQVVGKHLKNIKNTKKTLKTLKNIKKLRNYQKIAQNILLETMPVLSRQHHFAINRPPFVQSPIFESFWCHKGALRYHLHRYSQKEFIAFRHSFPHFFTFRR